jgi:acetylornithine deacetylase
MARVVHAIEQFQFQVLSQRHAHPLCGSPSVCVSTIQGGTGVNTVPDEVAIDIDRRVTPGEQPDVAYQELVDYVADDFAKHAVAERADCGEATIEHELPWLESPGLDDQHNREWGRRMAAVVRSMGSGSGLAGGAGELIGVPYGTDAPAIAACGIPTIVFGPGSIDQAHTKDEWLDLEGLSRAVEIFCRLACNDSR